MGSWVKPTTGMGTGKTLDTCGFTCAIPYSHVTILKEQQYTILKHPKTAEKIKKFYIFKISKY